MTDFSDIQQQVEKIRATLKGVKDILDQLNKPRSVICTIINLSDTRLVRADDGMDHGGFAVPPPVEIAPRSGGVFGAQSAGGALFTGTEGWVRYVDQAGLGVRLYWDNPWAGSNSADATLDGNVAPYVAWKEVGAGDQQAPMTYVVYQLPFPVGGAIRDKWMALGGIGGVLGLPKTAESPCPDGVGRFNHFTGGSIYWTPGTGAKEVQGLIRDKWASMGWERSILGYPASDETGCPDEVGRFNHFQGGSIYWTPSTGAHEVQGAIRDKWASMGWERSVLGYPTSDETASPDGVGRFNHFQGGSVFWTPATGAHEVQGAIRDKWASMGWERSVLGYPASDETGCPDGVGRFNHFQGGSIYWTPATGAHEVQGAIRDKWASLGWEKSALGYPTSDEMADPERPGGRLSRFQGGILRWPF